MRTATIIAAAIAVTAGALGAQETKPVPKDSMRVLIPGCAKGRIFTAGRRTEEEPGSVDVPEGTHFRMNAPKKVMEEIKAHEGAMIALTGLVKKGQYGPGGVAIGGHVRISPGSPSSPGAPPSAVGGQNFIDVEGWRQIAGGCPR